MDIDAALAEVAQREEAEQAKRAAKTAIADRGHKALMAAIGRAEKAHRIATEQVEIRSYEC